VTYCKPDDSAGDHKRLAVISRPGLTGLFPVLPCSVSLSGAWASGLYLLLQVKNLCSSNSMVRAGVVKHPSHWDCSGHNEILQPRRRYRLIDYETLLGYCSARGYTEFCRDYIGWIDEELQNGAAAKESLWTESIAVGSKEFIEDIKTKMGSKAKGRQVRETDDKWGLCEPEGAYNTNFTLEKDPLRPENALLWGSYRDESAG